MTPSGPAGNARDPPDSELWTAVDRYITDTLVGHDPALEAALEASASAGLPPIAVSPPQGKLLWLLARLQNAREVLELGTLGAYSTIWLARAVGRGGRVDGRAEPHLCGGSDRQCGPRATHRPGRPARRPGRGGAGADDERGRGPLRSDLHRRGQEEHAGVLHRRARALAPRDADRHRQRRARRRADRREHG